MNIDPNGTSWWSDLWGGIVSLFSNIGNVIEKNIAKVFSMIIGGFLGGISSLINGTKISTGILVGVVLGGLISQESINSLSLKNLNIQAKILSQPITGGPYVDLDAKGWGKDGKFILYHKIMSIIAGIGYLGILVGVGMSFISIAIGKSIFAISTVVAICASIMGGFGGAT